MVGAKRLSALGEAMALELSYFVDKLLVSGFVVQDFFIELFSIELIEGSGRRHGADFD